MSRHGRVVGRPDDLDLAFYRRLASTAQLHVQRCVDCGAFAHPPRYLCPACGGREQEFVPVSGRGTVHSYTVSHTSAEPWWRERAPYVTLVVELEEGVRVVAAGRDLSPERVAIGLPVTVDVEPEGEEFAFLWATEDEKGTS